MSVNLRRIGPRGAQPIDDARSSDIRKRMNWRAVAFDWNQAKAFLATAQEGSLSAAARVLATTQPTVGRQVAALEEALGVVLFDRVGRSLALTPCGMDLLEHVACMRDAASRLSLTASGRSQSVAGRVCITAAEGMSCYHLPKVLARLREVAPAIEVEVLASNSVRDLRLREADIAIRHVRPEQPELISKLVRTMKAHLWAATRYLKASGRPQTLADLERAPFVGFEDPDRMVEYLQALGLPLTRNNVRVSSNSGVATWEMIKQGLGIGLMTDDLGCATEGVEVVLPEQVSIDVPVWLTTHRELHASRRVRLVFDLLAESLV